MGIIISRPQRELSTLLILMLAAWSQFDGEPPPPGVVPVLPLFHVSALCQYETDDAVDGPRKMAPENGVMWIFHAWLSVVSGRSPSRRGPAS
jgi:hypothetical protein